MKYLFNFSTNWAAFLDTSRILVEIKHWWIVVTIANLDTERTEPSQHRTSVVLGLHRHAKVCHADLSLAIEHIRCLDQSGHRVDLEPIDSLVSRLDQRVCDVAVGADIQVHSFNLPHKLFCLLYKSTDSTSTIAAIYCQNGKKNKTYFITLTVGSNVWIFVYCIKITAVIPAPPWVMLDSTPYPQRDEK